jgi:RHS repeat-associated protein
MQGAGGIGGLLCVIRNGVPYFPCYDGNGNISDYVNTNGVVVAHREYDPFGNTVVATGPMVNDFNFWFSTKYLDQETGLYYYGYRHYSPFLGRWLNRDPMGERYGINLYIFVRNNCVRYFDYLGLYLSKEDVVSRVRDMADGSYFHGIAMSHLLTERKSVSKVNDPSCSRCYRVFCIVEQEYIGVTIIDEIIIPDTFIGQSVDNIASSFINKARDRVRQHEAGHRNIFRNLIDNLSAIVSGIGSSCDEGVACTTARKSAENLYDSIKQKAEHQSETEQTRWDEVVDVRRDFDLEAIIEYYLNY